MSKKQSLSSERRVRAGGCSIHSQDGWGGGTDRQPAKENQLPANLPPQPEVADPGIDDSIGYANLCK